MTITKPAKTYSFVATTVAKSSEVNTNFDNAFNMYGTSGYLYDGWFALDGASLEYHATDAVKTTADVNLTNDLQVGDRVTFEQSSTEKFYTIININYNLTVANRTYIQLTGDTVANSAITAGTVGFSRHIRPYKFPAVPFFGNETSGLINGKIAVSVASNDLTVAIKTLADTDPSASNPVGVFVGGQLRWITSARTWTLNAGTNYANAGSAELATKEIDYFVYAGWCTLTNSVDLLASRIPYARTYNDFNYTATNEKTVFGFTGGSVTLTDNVVLVDRFAATLSAGAGHTWSNAGNVYGEPVYETRLFEWAPTYTGFSVNPVSNLFRYKIINSRIILYLRTATLGTSNANTFTLTTPMAAINYGSTPTFIGAVQAIDNGATLSTFAAAIINGGSNSIQMRANPSSSTSWTTSGSKGIGSGELTYEI